MKFVALALIFFSSLMVNAANISILKGVSTKFDKGAFVAELSFDRDIGAQDILVEYINETVQLNIPGATISTGKQLNRVNEKEVKSVYTYQFQPDIMRLRIIHDKGVKADHFEGFVKVDDLGKKIRVSIFDPKSAKSSAASIDELDIVPPISLDSAIKEEIASVPLALPEKGKLVLKAQEDQDREVASALAIAKSLDSGKSTKKMSTRVSDKKVLKAETESEIPVFAKSKEKPAAIENSYSRMIYSMLVLAILAGGILVFTRWWSKNHKPNVENTKISVLTQHHLGPKKSLTIVRVAGEYLLLGVTDQNISMLKTLSLIDDEFAETVPSNFKSTLRETGSEKHKSLPEQKVTYEPPSVADPLGDLKSQVRSKLGKMRNI